jgi:serine/threonine protein phosphatase PrpC
MDNTVFQSNEYIGISLQGEHTPGVNSDSIVIKESTEHRELIAIICDGVSGNGVDNDIHSGKYIAENATKLAANSILQLVKTENVNKESLNVAMRLVSDSLFRLFSEFPDIEKTKVNGFYAATTIVGLVLLMDSLWLFSVGDSSGICFDKNYDPMDNILLPLDKDNMGRITSSLGVRYQNDQLTPIYPNQVHSVQIPRDSNLRRAMIFSDGFTTVSGITDLAWFLSTNKHYSLLQLADSAVSYATSLENAEGLFLDDKTIFMLDILQ